MLDFIGIGAQKAGTTWLYENLRKHPGIRFPTGKELHFWDAHYANGIEWYKSLFPNTGAEIKNGEITPAYAILPQEKIKEVHENFPDVQLIYILRDPIERAWSAALMALERAEMQIAEASDQWFIDHFNSQGSLQRGDYESCIANWLKFYPRHQLLIMDFRKIKINPLAFLKQCAAHIGVTESFFDAISEKAASEKIHATTGNRVRPSLLPVMEKIYREKRKFYESLFPCGK